MKSKVEIEAGVCGFKAVITAQSPDGCQVKFHINTDCPEVPKWVKALQDEGNLDIMQNFYLLREDVLVKSIRLHAPDACGFCAVPLGLSKAIQVATGLALPKDIHLKITKEEE